MMKSFFIIIALIAIIIGWLQHAGRKQFHTPSHGSAILITGCSTGIGRDAAEVLATMGYHILAGIRKDGDIQASKYLHPLLLDVTDPASIASAVDEVTSTLSELGGVPLAGLVNNAGVAYVMPIQLVDLDRWRDLFEVNVVGVVAMTKVR